MNRSIGLHSCTPDMCIAFICYNNRAVAANMHTSSAAILNWHFTNIIVICEHSHFTFNQNNSEKCLVYTLHSLLTSIQINKHYKCRKIIKHSLACCLHLLCARACVYVKERDQKIPPTNSIMQCIYLYLPIHIKQINLIIKLIIKHRGKKQGIWWREMFYIKYAPFNDWH